MVQFGSRSIQQHSLNNSKVLYKRKPVKFEPLPKNLDDNTEVRQIPCWITEHIC